MTVRLGMLPQFSFSSGKVVSILNLREGKQLPFILVQNYLQMWFKWESYLFSSLISVSNWNQRRGGRMSFLISDRFEKSQDETNSDISFHQLA